MFLVDECLSEKLASRARQRGYPESTHVRWIGKTGWQDYQLMPIITEAGYVFVTKNSFDFRGPADAPGPPGLFAGVNLHAGLICLNGPVGMDLDMQCELFEYALEEYQRDPDLYNAVIEVTLSREGADKIAIVRYLLPRDPVV
jgi:hypothetical protein